MIVFACIGWFCIVATVICQNMPISALERHVGLAQSQHVDIAMVKSDLFLPPQIRSPCRNGMCGGVSYNEIMLHYKGLFFTEAELQNYTQQKQDKPTAWSAWVYAENVSDSNSRIRLRSVHNHHDGDKCCPTSRSYMCPRRMKNTRGQLRWIVHFEDLKPEPKYQFIPRGQCWYRRRCQLCVQEYALHNILVVNEKLLSKTKFPFEFDLFRSESYCSCKG